ncbi:Uncharacterized protein Rs2_18217 [Raphanus sativus]|nr:Uncharacterized protein Rs2_18217 [Raphanus sativus]
MVDGIPVVLAPETVVLQASESWKDHIIAHFHGRCPAPAKIFNDLNPVWGKHGNITIHALSQTACLIYVPSVSTRQWVLEIGYWQVDNCAMTAVPWTAEASLEQQELVTAPTWVILKSVPPQLYSLDGISVIASGIGDPLHTENSKLEPFHFGDTKVKVEIKMENPPPIAVIVRDSYGYSVRVNVEYPRLPPQCCNCGKFGHMLKYCLMPIQRKNFKSNQTIPRVSSSASQVTVEDKELLLVPPSPSTPMETAAISQEPVTNKVDIGGDSDGELLQDVLPVIEVQEASQKLLRSTGFPPHTGKPALRFLTHRLDRNKKLRTHRSAPFNPERLGPFILPPSPSPPLPPVKEELEEGEIPFLPSPTAVKKAKKLKKLESRGQAPSQAVSQMFSSIRGKALGRKPRHF